MGDRAKKRWDDKLPDRDTANILTWKAVRDVLFPMMREMADEIEAMRAELASMRESRRKGKTAQGGAAPPR